MTKILYWKFEALHACDISSIVYVYDLKFEHSFNCDNFIYDNKQ